MNILLSVILSYLLGSIPTAYLIVRMLQKKDIRKIGSGNVGTANVWCLAGWKAAVVVLLCDIAKGIWAVCICYILHTNPSIGLVMSVAGHIYTPWLKFHGGKGLAAGLGGVLALGLWQAVIVFAGIWVISYLLIWKKNMDLANLAGVAGVMIYGFAAGPHWGIIIMAAIIILKHCQVIKISKQPVK